MDRPMGILIVHPPLSITGCPIHMLTLGLEAGWLRCLSKATCNRVNVICKWHASVPPAIWAQVWKVSPGLSFCLSPARPPPITTNFRGGDLGSCVGGQRFLGAHSAIRNRTPQLRQGTCGPSVGTLSVAGILGQGSYHAQGPRMHATAVWHTLVAA